MTGAAITQECPGRVIARLAAGRAPIGMVGVEAGPIDKIVEGLTPRDHGLQRRNAREIVGLLRAAVTAASSEPAIESEPRLGRRHQEIAEPVVGVGFPEPIGANLCKVLEPRSVDHGCRPYTAHGATPTDGPAPSRTWRMTAASSVFRNGLLNSCTPASSRPWWVMTSSL